MSAAAAASSSALARINNSSAALSRPTAANGVVPLGRVAVFRARAARGVAKQSTLLLDKRFLGTRLRGSALEKLHSLHSWQSDGPLRDPKLKVVVRSSMSLVPEKPLGLYDPSLDKDSCGVGFVAELSGKGSSKTVTDAIEMLVRMAHRGACGCETNIGDGAGILRCLFCDLACHVIWSTSQPVHMAPHQFF